MERLKIKFHPLFAIYVFLCIYFGWFNNIFYYVIVVTLHEFGHYVMMCHYGYRMESLVFSLNGAGLKGNSVFKEKHEILISLAGPLVNVLLIIMTIALWWIYPLSYLYTREFFIGNIVVMIFNLLPIYPLDGGRILIAILVLKNKDRNVMLKYNRIICIALGVILSILFFLSIFYKINYNLAIISVFMFVNSISLDKNAYFDKISCLSKNSEKPIEVRVFRVNYFDKVKMLRYLNPHYYSIFEIVHGDKKVIIEEKDLINKL